MKITKTLLTAAVLLTTTGVAQAALVDRGGGLIYDTDLNVTWLQNVNVNVMTWSQANTWAANLSYYDSVRNVTYTDWRLPTVNPINGSTFIYISTSYDGSTDYGYNFSEQGTAYAGSTVSEMAHLFYNSLDNKSVCPVSTNCSPMPQPGSGLFNKGPFTHLQPYYYWSSAEYAVTSTAWLFDFRNGFQGAGAKSVSFYALAVRPGDVAAVPVPAALWLFGTGLLGLAGAARKKTQT